MLLRERTRQLVAEVSREPSSRGSCLGWALGGQVGKRAGWGVTPLLASGPQRAAGRGGSERGAPAQCLLEGVLLRVGVDFVQTRGELCRDSPAPSPWLLFLCLTPLQLITDKVRGLFQSQAKPESRLGLLL